MSILTSHADQSVLALDPLLSAGKWIVTNLLSVSTSPYDLDVGTITLCALSTASASNVASTWIGKSSATLFPNMYVTSISTSTKPGGITQATLTLKGVCSPKYCKKTISLDRKEMTVTNGKNVRGYSAPVPCMTLEYLTGPGLSVKLPANPPNPPGIVFSGNSKANSPNGWVVVSGSSDNIEGTPFAKKTERRQWVYALEPANS